MLSTSVGTATFIITRDDQAVDPITLVSEGLSIGRLADCELILNHPTVSRLHAGIKEVDGRFYLFNLNPSNSMVINGRRVGEREALADGDIIQLGPFFLYMRHEGAALSIRVVNQPGVRVGEAVVHDGDITQALPFEENAFLQTPPPQTPAHDELDDALSIFWAKRQRESGKIQRASPLRPQNQARPGRALFNWTPTRDLSRPWPPAFVPLMLIAAALVAVALGLLSSRVPFAQAGGGLPLLNSGSYRWAAAALLLSAVAAAGALRNAARTRQLLKQPLGAVKSEEEQRIFIAKDLLEKYDPEGPNYPHPVIIAERCIGCHACVDACPHDVLAIVNGIAAPIALDQCMEDTSCQVECPVNPKACVVVNTTKKILPRKVPHRDASFETDVKGCYIIGDVSGTPLIKNAANEGAAVMHNIANDLRANAGNGAQPEYDVLIVGAGPAGLSAAIVAQSLGLRYLVVERDRTLATIEKFPRQKYVFLKPESMDMLGPLAVDGTGAQREELLAFWSGVAAAAGIRVNEGEQCRMLRRAADGDYFVIETERDATREHVTYRARRLVLAIGNTGAPMRLKVPGEELRVERDGMRDDKVRYRLSDPEAYRGKRIMVVGAGNSAVEAAVDLVAYRRGDRIEFRPPDETNQVTLVVRSDFVSDLKFSNKVQVYDCMDEGRIKIYFGTAVKEIRPDEVVLMNARTREERLVVANDYIFVLIGAERQTKMLEALGVQIR